MKNTLLAPLLILIILSCTPEVEDDTRGFAKGRILESPNNPLADIPVEITPERYDKILGQTSTDENGDFNMVTNTFSGGYVYAKINQGDLKDSLFASKTFIKDASDTGFDLQQIEIRKRASLQLNIQHASQTEDTLSWILRFKPQNCSVYLGDQEPDNYGFQYRPCDQQQEFFNQQDPMDPDFSKTFRSLLNTQARFIYRLQNQDFDTITIPLNNRNTIYDFNY